MKLLRTEFQSNVDGCGLQTFKQLKLTERAALYQRIRSDGSTHSFEAFKIKIVKAGTKLPNGLSVQEDYVQYPGKTAFGKTAYSCKTLEHGEQRFDELNSIKVEDAQLSDDSESESDSEVVEKKSPSGGKRGRKPVDTSTLKFPKKGDKATMKQLHAMNSHVSIGFVYQYVKQHPERFAVAERVSGGRGKPEVVYLVTQDEISN